MLKMNINYLSLILLISAPALAMEQPPRLKPVAKPAAAIANTISSCNVCYEDKSAGDFRTLACGHKYCLACLRKTIQTAINEGQADALKCIDPSCKKPIELSDLRKIFYDKNHHNAINEIQFRDWLTKEKNTKYCPTTNCPFSFTNERGQFTHECPGCKKVYCGQCLHPHSAIKTCQHAEADRKLANDKNAQERANEEWVRANTRACPKCHTPIQKNQGCSHMTCRKCWHEFCWLCLQPYHGHSYANCSSLAAAIDNRQREQQQKQQQEQQIQITWQNMHLLFARDPRGFATTWRADYWRVPELDNTLTGTRFAQRFMNLSCEQQDEWTARISVHLENDRQRYITRCMRIWLEELEHLEPFNAILNANIQIQDGLLIGSIRFNRPVSPQFIDLFARTIAVQNPQDMILLNNNGRFEASINREQFQAALNRASAQFREYAQGSMNPTILWIEYWRQIGQQNGHPMYQFTFNRILSVAELGRADAFFQSRRELSNIQFVRVGNATRITFVNDRSDNIREIIDTLNARVRQR